MDLFNQTFLVRDLNVKILIDWGHQEGKTQTESPHLIGLSSTEVMFDSKVPVEWGHRCATFSLYFKVMGKWKNYRIGLRPAQGQSTQNSMPFELESHKMSEFRRDLLMARRRV